MILIVLKKQERLYVMETHNIRTAHKFYERTANAGFRRFITEVNHNVTITKLIKSHKMVNIILRKKQNLYEIEAYMPGRLRIIVGDQMPSEAAMKRFFQEVSLIIPQRKTP